MKYAGWSYLKTKTTNYNKAIKKIAQICYMITKNKIETC
jgi:hypothetical protein